MAVLLSFVLAITALHTVGLAEGRFGSQQVGARGRLICPTEPNKANNVKVWLVDKDIGFDDTLARARTDAQGNFAVNGSAFDLIGNINVQLKIYHQCLVGRIKGVFCDRRLVYKLPKSYLTKSGQGTMRIIDMGVINLEPEPKKEDSCNWTG